MLEARSVGAEQSNTSIVFDEELILKVFRRLEPGINPELEMLRFLTEHGFANIAALGGWYAYSRRADRRDARHPAAVRAGGPTAGSSARGDRAARRTPSSTRLRRLGEVTGEMHTVLGSEPNDPASAPETPIGRGARRS